MSTRHNCKGESNIMADPKTTYKIRIVSEADTAGIDATQKALEGLKDQGQEAGDSMRDRKSVV